VPRFRYLPHNLQPVVFVWRLCPKLETTLQAMGYVPQVRQNEGNEELKVAKTASPPKVCLASKTKPRDTGRKRKKDAPSNQRGE
jgi:hypothetical protein